jgi:hypothetical protein
LSHKQLHARVYALSIHADYGCRHSGVCCNVGWDVPVELPVYRSLSEAHASGRLKVSEAATGLAPFIEEPDLPDDAAAMFARHESGACVFFHQGSNLCIVHRDLGEPALPSTCRHFPRVAVRDPRGIFITLSHFCPTAASLLFREDVPLVIVERPPAFPPAEYEGLIVAGDDLPPLLRPRVLMDDEGYSAWERHMVAVCAAGLSPESVLATLDRDARVLRAWSGGGPSLYGAVAQLPRDVVAAPPPDTLAASDVAFAEIMRCVPYDRRPEPDEQGLAAAYETHVRLEWPRFGGPLSRYIAAKAFASWTAYQGRGVLSIVRGLEAALALVRVEAARQCRDAAAPLDADRLKEAFREADFVLNHLAVGEDLATAWSVVEAE